MLDRQHQYAEQERHQELLRQAAHERLVIEAQAGRPSLLSRLWAWISSPLSTETARSTYKSEGVTTIRTANQT